MNHLFLHSEKAVKTAFLLFSLFAVTACSSLQEISVVEPAGWEISVEQKQRITNWAVTGRLGIQAEQQGGSFDLYWKQEKDSYKIRLIAPLGLASIRILGNAKAVSFQMDQDEVHHSNDPEQLFTEQLGMDFPVSSLSSWMLGLPDKRQNIQSIKWDDNGQLTFLLQAGWKIEMSRYSVVGNVTLPHFFVLQRDDRPELVIRLLIRQWEL